MRLPARRIRPVEVISCVGRPAPLPACCQRCRRAMSALGGRLAGDSWNSAWAVGNHEVTGESPHQEAILPNQRSYRAEYTLLTTCRAALPRLATPLVRASAAMTAS